MRFRVGQKVVCINGKPGLDCVWHGDEQPIEGTVYTVRRVFLDKDGYEILWLDEITRSEIARREFQQDDLGYWSRRFRPIQERKTDISIFTRMSPPDKVSA